MGARAHLPISTSSTTEVVCWYSFMVQRKASCSQGTLLGRHRFQAITQFAGFALQSMHQAGLVGFFVDIYLLANVFVTEFQESVDAFGDLAGSGDDGPGAAAAGLDA